MGFAVLIAMSNLLICIMCTLCIMRVTPQVVLPLYTLPYLRPITATQYHSQDELGQFNFGYAGDNQARMESRLLDGVVRGTYSYVDPNNKLIHVSYVADSDGYRVLSGNNLPTVPSIPTPLVGPSPVDYTPEVASARAEFEKIYNELAAKAAEDSSEAEPLESKDRRRRSILLPSLYTIAPNSLKVKVNEAKDVKDVVSPADTKAVEFSQVEKSLPVTPLVVAPAELPFAPTFYTYYYTL